MPVDLSSSQRMVVTPVAAGPVPAQSPSNAQAPARPATFDTSGADNTQPANPGSAESGLIRNQLPPPGENVGTTWKLDPDGKFQYVGYFPAHQPQSNDNHNATTEWGYFKQRFVAGLTHPGQTVGAIVDTATGDASHRGENGGAKLDHVLENTPVVSDALKITRGLAGEKNPDGTPVLPEPNLQPDAEEHVRPGAAGGPSRNDLSGKPSIKESGLQSEQTDVPRAARQGIDDAPVKSAQPSAASSAGGSHFDVPEQYVSKPSGNLEADRDSPGIFRDDRGQAYIVSGDHTYPVRYDTDNGTWRAYRPDNTEKPHYPVRLDEQGNWQVHNDVGLKGGNPGDTVADGNNLANRDRLAETVERSPTGDVPGSYSSSVKIVNNLLQRLNINLSDQSAATIINNVKQVDSGQLAHGAASAREAWTFARDVADPGLPMKDRTAAALGMVVNGIAGPAYMAQFDLQNYHFGTNQSADLRRAMQMFLQFDSHA